MQDNPFRARLSGVRRHLSGSGKPVRWIGAGLAALLLAAGILPASMAVATQAAHTTETCYVNGHLIVYSPYGWAYQIRNNYWLGQRRQCIKNWGDRTNFTVVQQAGYDPKGKVVAFPDILRGCIWAICSPKAHLPRRVSRLGHIKTTVHTTGRAAGTWNAAYDIWFGKRRMITGQATGAELMIWINYHGGCCALQPGAPKVWIDGRHWWLSHWTAVHAGKSWNYVQFRLIHKQWDINNLRLHPFIHRIERLGLLRTNWWLENVEAGFEIWNGGRGLSVTKYSVRKIRPPS